MAYVYDAGLSEEENKKREEQSRGGGGIIGAGGAQPMSAGGQPAANGAPSASGSFTNLQRYLDENKAGSLDLGQKVAAQVKTAGEEAKGAAEGIVKTGGEQIEAARVKPTGIVDEAAQNPTAVVSDAAKKAAFERERDATYGGPGGLEDVEGFETAQQKVKLFQDRNALTQNEGGRMELLRSLNPTSGRGKLTLNQLLISGNPDAALAVSDAGKPFENLGGYLTAESDAARKRAVDAANEAAATRKAVEDRFLGEGGVIPGFISGLDEGVAGARSGASSGWSAIAQKLDNLEPLTEAELAQIGISKGELDRMYQDETILKTYHGNPLPLSGFLQQTGTPELITRENFASADDYARSAALAQLMGDFPGLLSESTRDQAGKANLDLGDIDQAYVGPTGERVNYKGINMSGDTRRVVADVMARLNEADAKSAQDIKNLFVGMEMNRLRGDPMPTVDQASKARLQNYIDRNYGMVPLRPEEKTLLFERFGFTAPKPPAPPPPTDTGPVLPNPYPPGGDVRGGGNPIIPPANNLQEIVGTRIMSGLTGGTVPITRGEVNDLAAQLGISYEDALARLTSRLYRSDERDKNVSKKKPDMDAFFESLRPMKGAC